MRTVLVTGGAGYIGSHCCKQLFNMGYKPVVFDNLFNGHRDNVRWGEFHEGDLSSVSDIMQCLENHEPSAVIHLAAYAYVGESITNPAKYYTNNVIGTINLLNCMVEKKIHDMIFSSTCATYGPPLCDTMDESHPQNPINPYGRSKLMVETILRDYARAYGMKYTILRYFNAAGADPDGELGERHDPETHLIPLVMDVALGKSSAINIYGVDYATKDGTCIRDYIHVTDLAMAHTLALEKELESGESAVYNVGTGRGFSVLEIIKSIARLTNYQVKFSADQRRPGDPAMLVADNSRIIRELNWKPLHSDIDSIIKTAWNWHSGVGR